MPSSYLAPSLLLLIWQFSIQMFDYGFRILWGTFTFKHLISFINVAFKNIASRFCKCNSHFVQWFETVPSFDDLLFQCELHWNISSCDQILNSKPHEVSPSWCSLTLATLKAQLKIKMTKNSNRIYKLWRSIDIVACYAQPPHFACFHTDSFFFCSHVVKEHNQHPHVVD